MMQFLPYARMIWWIKSIVWFECSPMQYDRKLSIL